MPPTNFPPLPPALRKTTTSDTQYLKYLRSLHNRQKESQIIYSTLQDTDEALDSTVLFTYQYMTGEKPELLPGTRSVVIEKVDEWFLTGNERGLNPMEMEKVFQAVEIGNSTVEYPPPGVAPAFVLYCRAVVARFVKEYSRETMSRRMTKSGTRSDDKEDS